MKQHITTEQLNELSKKGKERLGKWWKPKWGDRITSIEKISSEKEIHSLGFITYYNAAGFMVEFKKPPFSAYKDKADLSPLLSIGQMIEFLDGKSIDKHYTALNIIIFEQGVGGTILLPTEQWCDALWEAVKEKLEES